MSLQSPPTIGISEPSVRSLLLQLRFDGKMLASATGFVVGTAAGPALLTNRHNLTGRHHDTGQPLSKTGGIPNEVLVFHNSTRGLGVWEPRLERLYEGDQPRWIEHPTLRERADFVALPLRELHGVQLFPYLLEPSPQSIVVGPADVVSVVGFPFGLTAGGCLAIWATGFIASEPEVNFRDLPLMLIDCRSRPGQSGSAVIAYRHSGVIMQGGGIGLGGGPASSLLGIYSGRINSESDIGFVWKISAIRELVSAVVAPASQEQVGTDGDT
jgi:hypothetical protein